MLIINWKLGMKLPPVRQLKWKTVTIKAITCVRDFTLIYIHLFRRWIFYCYCINKSHTFFTAYNLSFCLSSPCPLAHWVLSKLFRFSRPAVIVLESFHGPTLLFPFFFLFSFSTSSWAFLFSLTPNGDQVTAMLPSLLRSCLKIRQIIFHLRNHFFTQWFHAYFLKQVFSTDIIFLLHLEDLFHLEDLTGKPVSYIASALISYKYHGTQTLP